MSNGDLHWIANYIWGIADDVLRDLYVRGKYRDVILPMTVLRRLDAVLEDSKRNVLEMKTVLDQAGVIEQDSALRQAAGQAFYNTSKFTLRDLRARASRQQLKADFEAYLDGFSPEMKTVLDQAGVIEQDSALRQAAGQAFYNTSKFTLRDLRARASRQQLKADFEAYLDGFSPNVQDILENFEFRNQIQRLSKADALGTLIEKLTSPDVNLSPAPVKNADGSVRHPGLDNHGMGSIFEELVRRFNEENNEEAGEHWTPRDAVRLMAKLVFLPVAEEIKSGTYLLYDGACGTGGMLTVAEETLRQLAAEHGKDVSTHLFGQEINAETYAICTADLLLKGEGEAADNIVGGPEHSTLANDASDRDQLDPILDVCAAVYVNELDEDAQVDFKGKAKAFVRTYGFLSSVLPYTYAPWEKRSIFLNLPHHEAAGARGGGPLQGHPRRHRHGQLSGREARRAADPAAQRERGDPTRATQRRRSHGRSGAEAAVGHREGVQRPLRRHRVARRRPRAAAHHRDHSLTRRRGRGLQERPAELGRRERAGQARQGFAARGDECHERRHAVVQAVHGQRGLQALDDRRGVRTGLRENGGRVRGCRWRFTRRALPVGPMNRLSLKRHIPRRRRPCGQRLSTTVHCRALHCKRLTRRFAACPRLKIANGDSRWTIHWRT